MPQYHDHYSDSLRREHWDYRQSAWYFITICTDRRPPYFGEVHNGIVGLTATGCVTAQYWQKIAELNERAVLDAFVVMPNHVHGLLGLLPTPEASLDSNDASSKISHSSPEKEAFSRSDVDQHMSSISPEAGSVSTILRSYKSAVTKRVRSSIRTDFGWQSRFDDHIVRSRQAFHHIRRYIQNNPARWERDRNHPARVNS